MSSSVAKPISITVSDTVHVSGLLQNPPQARACYVLAHGSGAGMNHPFMAAVAAELARRGIGTLRYQFPYMERGAKQPDPPRLAQATVRAAVGAALGLLPESPLIAGGKSFGGPDDVAGAGKSSAARSLWAGFPGISAASSRSPIAGARRASVRRSDPDAVLARNARHFGVARSN